MPKLNMQVVAGVSIKYEQLTLSTRGLKALQHVNADFGSKYVSECMDLDSTVTSATREACEVAISISGCMLLAATSH